MATSDTILQLKEKLAQASRIIAYEGYEDMQMGHISIRHPENREWFLIKRAGIGLEEVMGPEDIITVDWNGKRVEGEGLVHGEWPIHSEVYRLRDDIHSIVHAHPVYAVAISLTDEGVGPAGQPGCYFPHGVRVHDEIDIITAEGQAAEMVKAMGSDKSIILKSHGVVVGGESVEEATVAAVVLERAARIQWLAKTYGEIRWPSLESAVEKKINTFSPRVVQGRWDYLVRRLKRMESRS